MKLILDRKIIIIIIFALSMISVSVLRYLMPDIYKGEAIIKIAVKEVITSKELIDIIGHVCDRDIQGIFPDNPSTIKKIHLSPLAGSTDKLKISVELTDKTYFQSFINLFLAYCNSLPILNESIEQSRKKLHQRILDIDEAIKNSQIEMKEVQKLMKNNSATLVNMSPVEMQKLIKEFKAERIELNSTLEMLAGVQLVKQPHLLQNTVTLGTFWYLAVTAVTSLLAGFFIAALLAYLHLMKRQ